MKQFLFFLVVAFLIIPIQSFAAKAAEQAVSIRIISQIEVNKSKSSQGLFEGLTAEASALGLSEATIKGTVSYTALPNKSVRVKIKWHSLGMDTGGATEPLKAPLWSQFTVKDKKIEPGTQVTAKGDLEGVATAFLALQEKLKSDTPRHLVDSKETNKSNSEVKLADNGIAPSSSGTSGSSGSSTPTDSTSSDNSTVTTDLITTAWEKCQPRIDAENGVLNLQWRRTETNQDGAVVDQGACLDTGETVAGVKNYSNCSVFIDTASMKVFEKYSLSATVDGVDYSIADCALDLNQFANIQATQNQCGMRHDFNTGQSIQQERLFYTDNTGANVDVSPCQDTSIAYAHFLTEQTCNPTIDNVSNVVFINKRTAYRLNDGTMEFANDCRPVDQVGIPVLEEYCSPKYEHDFINNVSYYSTRNYYLDELGATKYISACARSATASFSHVFQTSGCSLTNDDVRLQSTQQSKTEIHTVDDGVIELVACQEQGQPTSYAYLRQDETVGAKFGPTRLNNIQIDSYGYPRGYVYLTTYTLPEFYPAYIDWTHSGNTITTSTSFAAFYNATATGVLSSLTSDTPWVAAALEGPCSFGITCAYNTVNATFNHTSKFTVYLRGDSTEYWKPQGADLSIDLVGTK
jgi:hypothetical protein